MSKCLKRIEQALDRLEQNRRLAGQLQVLCYALIRAIRTEDHPTRETLDLWTSQLDAVLTRKDLEEYIRWSRSAWREVGDAHPPRSRRKRHR
jgi:hypothetical protein